MLMAASHQTLSTGVRPFEAMRRFIHPSLAWAWAIATLVATFVFHLPQYELAAGVAEDMISVASGWQPTGGTRTAFLVGLGFLILAVSTVITWNYGRGIRGIRIYERTLKALVAAIIIAFFAVVARSALRGRLDWGSMVAGFLPLSIPSDSSGVTKVMGAFGAAVGINMTFLFGYTLLARGWGREHRGLARFDLITGMLLPYVIVTSLIVIACACTIYGTAFAPEQILPANVGMLIIRALRAARDRSDRLALSPQLPSTGTCLPRGDPLDVDGNLDRAACLHDWPHHASDRLYRLVPAPE